MRRLAFCFAFLACAAGSAAPVAAACWEAEEYEAARMRDLQTVLMVSALKCGRADPDMPLAYNKWVGRAKAKLLAGEQKLLAHFVREGDQSKYDKFTTALANRYSEYAEDSRFCARAKKLLDADEQNNGVLEEIALLINSKPNGVEEVCPVKRPPSSQIVVTPFDPLPVAGGAAPAAAPTIEAAASAAVAAPAAAPQPASAPAGSAQPVATPDAPAATPAATASAQPQ
jgi:hypothetical protein